MEPAHDCISDDSIDFSLNSALFGYQTAKSTWEKNIFGHVFILSSISEQDIFSDISSMITFIGVYIFTFI